MTKKDIQGDLKDNIRSGAGELTNNILLYLSKNVKYIVIIVASIFFGIVISWKADKGACLINCKYEDNKQDNSHIYYFREQDVKDIVDIIKTNNPQK
jgi:hypothetical protein